MDWRTSAIDFIMSFANVPFYIHPKGNEEIDNKRRAHAYKRGVNKVLAHFRRRQMHAFAEMLTYAECVPFNQVFEPVLQHCVIGLRLGNEQTTT